jgi:hypothetical protein
MYVGTNYAPKLQALEGSLLNGFLSLGENLEPTGKLRALPTLGLAQFAPRPGLPDISWHNIPKREKIYQIFKHT